jgi:hypothetical protein
MGNPRCAIFLCVSLTAVCSAHHLTASPPSPRQAAAWMDLIAARSRCPASPTTPSWRSSRCKCVSKPWRDLIADRLCCKDLPQTLQGFLYFGVGSRGGGDSSSDGAADANGGDRASSRDRMLFRHDNGRFINLLGKTMPLLCNDTDVYY